MRVISGAARGRKLREPTGAEIRPTSDMVKESLFNIVQFDIEGRRVLDLFAGTGQLGIEALSRGARETVFIDTSAAAVKLIRENLKTCGFESVSTVISRDGVQYLRDCARFDLILIDPPYDSALAERALAAIFEFDKLSDNGIIICETRTDKPMPDAVAPYFKEKEYRYGGIRLTRYTKRAVTEI